MLDICEAIFANKPIGKVFDAHAIARTEQQIDNGVRSEESAERPVAVQESEAS
jgi:hypothetical protein